MKTDKFYRARMDGLAYALEIVEKGGIEALKKELKVRNAYFIPMEISSKKAEELSEMLAHGMLATFVPIVMFSLNQNLAMRTKDSKSTDRMLGKVLNCDMIWLQHQECIREDTN